MAIDDFPNLNKKVKHDISIIVDRIVLNSKIGNRLADSVETALNLSNGLLTVEYENETIPKNLRKKSQYYFLQSSLVLKVGLQLKKLNQDYSHLTLLMEHVKNVRNRK